ncbi:MAG: DUF1549 domain-containing protein [Verrucomicrobiales bacterium]
MDPLHLSLNWRVHTGIVSPVRYALTSLALLLLPLATAHSQTWDDDIRPLLAANCSKCHGGAKQKGGLDLRSQDAVLRGGESGAAIVPQKPSESLLIQLVQAGSDPHMPPKKQLAPEEIDTLTQWVAHLGAQMESAVPAGAADRNNPALQLPAGVDPSLATDLYLQAEWQQTSTTPAAPSSDATFVRRIYIDLIGRIPTRAERDAFLADSDSGKRSELIDRLTGSDEHAAHLAEVFNVIFLDREDSRKRKRQDRGAWLDYLRWAFKTNRPWDEIGRDLIVARPGSAQENGASWFLYEQRDDHQEIATRTSATLLGKQVQCAQCHDHPVSPEIEQRHYWGLVSFFSRSLNVKTPEGPRVAERASGGYAKFSNLEGESSETELVMLTGKMIEEPDGRRDQDTAELYEIAPPEQWFKKLKKDEKLKKDLGALPVPKFSRREELANATTVDNPAFPRAIVNRVWAMVFGRGLVHPVDQMDSAHPPSHPELLDWLSRDFAASGYDVRRLIRALTKTQAYQLDFVGPPQGGDGLPPQDSQFARALDKPLSAEALYRSMRVAAGHGSGEDEAMRANFANTFPELFPEVYSPSVQQAMFVTNGTLIEQLLGDGAPLVGKLVAIGDPAALTEQAFIDILGRLPDTEERERGIAYLAPATPDRVRQLCWALLAGSEFRINH